MSSDESRTGSLTQNISSEQANAIPSTASLDSEALVSQPANPTPAQTSPPAASTGDNADIKQCWICYVDETEDTPTSSRWRKPCPCALVAHEACLLDWVADLEAPSSRSTHGVMPKIQCPQCKRDITIARPRSPVVATTKYLEWLSGKLVLPGLLMGVCGGLYTTFTMHGIVSVAMVFGKKEFERMVEGPHIAPKFMAVFPMVPVALIISRTTLADQILPTLPILIYATKIPTWSVAEIPQLWPPTPMLAFYSLPFLRSVYRQTWKRLFANMESRWTKEVQPRAGEGSEDEAGAGNPAEVPANGEPLDIFNFEVEIVDDDAPAAAPAAAVPQAGAQAVPDNGANANQGAAQPAARQARQITLAGSRIMEVVMGALAFPAIASLMGDLLKAGLPKSWTIDPSSLIRPGGYALRIAAPSQKQRPGLLMTRWGRTIVGGCLFVVMKDALQLYSKYRLAKDHQKRRVCNWDRKTGRIVD